MCHLIVEIDEEYVSDLLIENNYNSYKECPCKPGEIEAEKALNIFTEKGLFLKKYYFLYQ